MTKARATDILQQKGFKWDSGPAPTWGDFPGEEWFLAHGDEDQTYVLNSFDLDELTNALVTHSGRVSICEFKPVSHNPWRKWFCYDEEDLLKALEEITRGK